MLRPFHGSEPFGLTPTVVDLSVVPAVVASATDDTELVLAGGAAVVTGGDVSGCLGDVLGVEVEGVEVDVVGDEGDVVGDEVDVVGDEVDVVGDEVDVVVGEVDVDGIDVDVVVGVTVVVGDDEGLVADDVATVVVVVVVVSVVVCGDDIVVSSTIKESRDSYKMCGNTIIHCNKRIAQNPKTLVHTYARTHQGTYALIESEHPRRYNPPILKANATCIKIVIQI